MVEPPGLLVAVVSAALLWLLHAPWAVAAGGALAVLVVKVVAALWLTRGPEEDVVVPPKPVRHPLTRREWEICLLLTEGLTNKEIAGRLFITEAAVDSHLANARAKLKVHNRAEIARWVTERLNSPAATSIQRSIPE